MKNLVYLCCFLNKNYIRFLELLFGSIACFSKESLPTFDLLVITQEDFVEEIRTIAEAFHIPVVFWVKEKPYSIFISTVMRYELFLWDNIQQYNKALYIDTDILIHGELSIVFDSLIQSDKLYTFREGLISHDFWGGNEIFDFQGKDKEIDPNTQGFCTGVLLFQQNLFSKSLFNITKHYILEKLQVPGSRIPICYDQPYLNYICVKYGVNENETLHTFCINRSMQLVNSYVVYHFPETMYTKKYTNMIIMGKEMLKGVHISNDTNMLLSFIEKGKTFLQTYDEYSDPNKKFLTSAT